jgi:hypothetical protein
MLCRPLAFHGVATALHERGTRRAAHRRPGGRALVTHSEHVVHAVAVHLPRELGAQRDELVHGVAHVALDAIAAAHHGALVAAARVQWAMLEAGQWQLRGDVNHRLRHKPGLIGLDDGVAWHHNLRVVHLHEPAPAHRRRSPSAGSTVGVAPIHPCIHPCVWVEWACMWQDAQEGMQAARVRTSTSTSTHSSDGRTLSTLPTRTPRTRTGVPMVMPHATGNSSTACGSH